MATTTTRFVRPRVKAEHRPVRLDGGRRIRIGGMVYGVASEVQDPKGAVWALLDAMDGTRTVDEVVAHVAAAHDEEPGAVREAIDELVAAGHVEDAAAPDPEGLTARDKQRHDRSRMLYRWMDTTPRANWWEPQQRLRDARVVVIGMGGTGGHAALSLAAAGVGALHCVDHDVVELSNLNRQVLFTEADVGRLKVEAGVERLRALNSDIRITGERCRITGTEQLRALVERCDVLALFADQPGEIRAWANRACLDAGRPWVDAGYHGPVPQATAYVPGSGACYECVWLTAHDRWAADGNTRPYSVRRHGNNAVFAPSAAISGQLAAHLVIALLTGVAQVRPGVTWGVNLVAPDHHFLVESRWRDDCPACGGPARVGAA